MVLVRAMGWVGFGLVGRSDGEIGVKGFFLRGDTVQSVNVSTLRFTQYTFVG